jgi:hypothetical protein
VQSLITLAKISQKKKLQKDSHKRIKITVEMKRKMIEKP